MYVSKVQRFSDLPEPLGLAISSGKTGKLLNPNSFSAKFQLGMEKFSVKRGIPLKTIPVNPKISVLDSEVEKCHVLYSV